MSDIDWKNPFCAKDFEYDSETDRQDGSSQHYVSTTLAAQKANRCFRELLEQAPVRYFDESYWSFDCDEMFKASATHKGRLIAVEKIGK